MTKDPVVLMGWKGTPSWAEEALFADPGRLSLLESENELLDINLLVFSGELICWPDTEAVSRPGCIPECDENSASGFSGELAMDWPKWSEIISDCRGAWAGALLCFCW